MLVLPHMDRAKAQCRLGSFRCIEIRPCFTLVTDHIPEFVKRGLCARDPKRALADSIAMRMPRKPANGDAFKPYSPAATLPYAHRWRLVRTPNDAFLTSNTHREGTPLLDILQPAYAGLYSGAIHPTAEAHAPSSPITWCGTSGLSWDGKMRRKTCSRAGRNSRRTDGDRSRRPRN